MASPISLPDAYFPLWSLQDNDPFPWIWSCPPFLYSTEQSCWDLLLSFFFQHLTQSRYLHLWTWPRLTHCRSALMGLTPCQLYDLYTCPPAGCTTYGPDPLQILLLLGLSPYWLHHLCIWSLHNVPPIMDVTPCRSYNSWDWPHVNCTILYTWPPRLYHLYGPDPQQAIHHSCMGLTPCLL